MARRLTNMQMTVLSERVTDLLEEAHKKQYKGVKESAAYQNFEKEYQDTTAENLAQLNREYIAKQTEIAKLEQEKENLKVASTSAAVSAGYLKNWSNQTVNPTEALEWYLRKKKNEVYPDVYFNRDKTLRRVQADILLSDVDNPEELVRSLVEKMKEDGTE